MPSTQSRRPACLLDQAEEHANTEHSRRLAELKELAPLLAKLDDLVPALKARGLEVHATDLSLRLESLTGDHSHRAKQHRVLRLNTTGLFSRQTLPAKWLAALMELGFTTIQADKPGTPYPQATIRRKHLLLRVDLTNEDAVRLATPAPAAAATAAQTSAAQEQAA